METDKNCVNTSLWIPVSSFIWFTTKVIFASIICESPDKGSEAASWKRAADAGAGIAAYTALIWVCGLLLASIVMMFGFIVLLGDAGKPGQRLLKAGILSVLLSGIFYLLFAVPLPSGILFGG